MNASYWQKFLSYMDVELEVQRWMVLLPYVLLAVIILIFLIRLGALYIGRRRRRRIGDWVGEVLEKKIAEGTDKKT